MLAFCFMRDETKTSDSVLIWLSTYTKITYQAYAKIDILNEKDISNKYTAYKWWQVSISYNTLHMVIYK